METTDPPPALPFPRSYWARPRCLLGGCYPGDQNPQISNAKLSGLVEAGVSCVVNLMEPDEVGHDGKTFIPYEARLQGLAQPRGRTVRCRRFPIVDGSIPTIPRMREILDFIDGEIAQGVVVFVHCWGGRGRTGTVIGCHLLRHGLATAENVLERLAQLTAHERSTFGKIPETASQRAFVQQWKETP